MTAAVLIVMAVALVLLLYAVFLVASGEPLPDEPTTMDVQNHIGD